MALVSTYSLMDEQCKGPELFDPWLRPEKKQDVLSFPLGFYNKEEPLFRAFVASENEMRTLKVSDSYNDNYVSSAIHSSMNAKGTKLRGIENMNWSNNENDIVSAISLGNCMAFSGIPDFVNCKNQFYQFDENRRKVMSAPRGHIRVVSPPPPSSLINGEIKKITDTITYRRGHQTPVQIKLKFGSLGQSKGQFNSPHGFCIGPNEDIVVCDTNNHRIQVFRKDGEFRYQFGLPGTQEGQIWFPRKIAFIPTSGKFVVCDRGNERSRMQVFSRYGQFIRKIAIRYIDIVAGLTVTDDGYIVAVDSVSPSCFVIDENGVLLKWFDCSQYMKEPSDIVVSKKNFYICDFKAHCVAVFDEHGSFIRKVGNEFTTKFPNGIDVSDAGDVVVGDSHGNKFHVAVFSPEGALFGEFECPYVKVSRCCGLKLTSEGTVVTLAKNNHHVLMLSTLFVK